MLILCLHQPFYAKDASNFKKKVYLLISDDDIISAAAVEFTDKGHCNVVLCHVG